MDIIYRAFDGKEFEKEDDCLCYEKEITAVYAVFERWNDCFFTKQD